MNFTEKELNGFDKLFQYAWNAGESTIFKFVNDDVIIKARVDCFYETDNGLELDNPNYEEYNAIAFENVETHELFEINYLNLPQAVYCNGERIL